MRAAAPAMHRVARAMRPVAARDTRATASSDRKAESEAALRLPVGIFGGTLLIAALHSRRSRSHAAARAQSPCLPAQRCPGPRRALPLPCGVFCHGAPKYGGSPSAARAARSASSSKPSHDQQQRPEQAPEVRNHSCLMRAAPALRSAAEWPASASGESGYSGSFLPSLRICHACPCRRRTISHTPKPISSTGQPN